MANTTVEQPDRRFLSNDLKDKVWSQLTDPTALEDGDWIFDNSIGSYYAGQITSIVRQGGETLIRVTWHKAPGNIFPWTDILSPERMEDLLWVDPMEEGNCDEL